MKPTRVLSVLLVPLMIGACTDADQPQPLEAEPTLSFGPKGRVYEVRPRRGEMAPLTDEALRGRDRAAFNQLLDRAETEEQREFLADILAEGKHPGIVAVEGDSVAASLISEILTARQILLERHPPGPTGEQLPGILDDGDTP